MNTVTAPLRVALVTHSLDRGGSPISLWNLARRLPDCHRVVVSEKDGVVRERFEQAGMAVRLEPRGGLLETGLLWRFVRLFRTEGIQLVHLNTLTSYFKYPALAARLLGIPVVWFIREDVREPRCRKLLLWIKLLATRIVPVSAEIARNLYPSGCPAKVRVILNGIEPAPAGVASGALRRQLGVPAGEPLVGCVAALEPRKGVGDLVAALAQLHGGGLRLHGVCLGQDRSTSQLHRRRLEQQATEAGIRDRFHLLGDHPNPLEVYPEFDVFVLPAHWEGCARTLLEAMLHGRPIVTTDGGGNPEVIRHGETGLVVPVGNRAELAEAVRTLVMNRPLALQLGTAARADLERRFTLDQHVAAVRAAYMEAMNDRPRRVRL